MSSSVFDFGAHGDGEASLWKDVGLRMIETIQLPAIRLDTLLAANAVSASDYNFWVLDVQGAEGLVVAGATQSLEGCKAILCEVSCVDVYEGGINFSDLAQLLDEHGFIPLWTPYYAHDDVLFVRRLNTPYGAFHSTPYLSHNARRLEHLASLNLPIHGSSVLEVGAGIGDHTTFYTDRGCAVVATEG